MVYYQLVEFETDTGTSHHLKLYLNEASPPWVSPRATVIETGIVDANAPPQIRDWVKRGEKMSLHIPNCNCGCRCK
jgi:hypothetical protein